MTTRRIVLVGALVAPLVGCGFELRRAPALAFRSIALVGFARHSPLAAELRRSLAQVAEVSSSPHGAAVVLEALAERREKIVVASTAAGQVRELQLRVRLNFRLSTRAGKPLLEPDEILLKRDMTYRETDALAKEAEESELYKAMEADVAQRVLHRLAAVKAL